ncbi:MAG: MarR family winged helix-turn-helix transcriptional regulator [Bacilli bacterium]
MYEDLKIENQMCFPLYVCSKEIIRKYNPLLEKINLTYTQYIVMMVMWEHEILTVNELGKYLYLDSGTLTPLLKKLEEKKYIIRKKNKQDERYLNIEITINGKDLKKDSLNIHNELKNCFDLTEEELKSLYRILYKVINKFKIE